MYAVEHDMHTNICNALTHTTHTHTVIVVNTILATFDEGDVIIKNVILGFYNYNHY